LTPQDFTEESVTPPSTRGPWPFPATLLPPTTLRAKIEITPGTVLEASMESNSSDRSSQREMTLAVPEDNVPPSALLPGARIDVAATYGVGTGASTVLVATQLPVVAVIDSTNSGNAEITVAIEHQITALALAQALQLAKITVINATGVRTDSAVLVYPPTPSASNG